MNNIAKLLVVGPLYHDTIIISSNKLSSQRIKAQAVLKRNGGISNFINYLPDNFRTDTHVYCEREAYIILNNAPCIYTCCDKAQLLNLSIPENVEWIHIMYPEMIVNITDILQDLPHNVTLSIDLASFLSKTDISNLIPLLKRTNYLFASFEEIYSIYQHGSFNSFNWEKIPNTTLLLHSSVSSRIVNTECVKEIKNEYIDKSIYDTIGAGDIWSAHIIYKLVDDYTIEDAIIYSNKRTYEILKSRQLNEERYV